MPGQQLVIPLGSGLPDPAQQPAALPWPARGVAAPLWLDVVSHPLGSGPGSALCGPSGEVREAGLPSDLIQNIVCSALSRLLGHAVRRLVAWHPRVGRDPEDDDLVIVVGHQGVRSPR